MNLRTGYEIELQDCIGSGETRLFARSADGTNVISLSHFISQESEAGLLKLLMSKRCLVQFCRKACPVLPVDAPVFRSSGGCLCDVCGKDFRDHPTYAYPTGMKHVVRDCRGGFWHL